MAGITSWPTFVLEDTRHRDYRYIREGLTRRGWKQMTLPGRHRREGSRSNSDSKHSSWVHHGGAMGIASAGQKNVICPDLIWTLSSGRSPGLDEAGLCRTLQTVRCGSSKSGEDVDSPRSFFPRSFDLSDSSTLDDFKHDYRQTAAAAVLKMFCRLLAESPKHTASTGSAAGKPSKRDTGRADSTCCSLNCRGAGRCLGDVHAWMLNLAVRACRRCLLEMSGWREDHTGVPSNADGAESLTDQEWESLLIYNYILRRVVHALPDAAVDSGTANGKAHPVHRQSTASRWESQELEERISPCGVGLRGLRGLRDTSASILRKGNDRISGRPSSAPAGGHFSKTVSSGRHCFSMHRQMAAIDGLSTGCGRVHCSMHLAAPGKWAPEEIEDLRGGLSKIWSASGLYQPTCCTCPDGTSGGRGGIGGFKSGREGNQSPLLGLEAAQLCTALEKRCPQWGMDGERNLWMLKPAGASRGQGVRVAWTLDQILHAQQTMGGRVVQKYVEMPLLLSRCRQHTTPPGNSRPSQLHGEGVPQEENVGLEKYSTARRCRGDGKNGARRADVTEAELSRKIENLVPLEAVETAPPSWNGESALPARSPLRRPEDANLCDSEGSEKHVDIGPSASAGARKFDIRTWVLVTGWKPLEAFVFDECYLRVCPRGFTLADSKFSDQGVHLTNLSVRRTVEACGRRQWRGGTRRRPSSASTAGLRAANREGGGTPADLPKDLPVSGPTGSERDAKCTDEWHAGENSSDGVVGTQAELIQRLGELDGARGVRWPTKSREEEARARGERLWRSKVSPSIDGVIRRTLLAAKPCMRPRAPSFQLFGFDLHLDCDLNPWLLEVNLSPALSHSSKRQSAIIRSMCEGLLRLTVDRLFPALPSSSSNTSVDSEIYYSEGPDQTGDSQCSSKWRPIFASSLEKQSALDAGESARNPSAQVFSLRGQHLTKRGLLRAERGVRESTAAKVLAAWWRSRADECRESRSRRLGAAAKISLWIVRLTACRRRRVLSAKVIQASWRRATASMSEARSLTTRSAACVAVQTMWKRCKLERSCRSRHARRKVSSGLRSWAPEFLSRRRARAAEIIFHTVTDAARRKTHKRHAATVIVRGLKTTCTRRRHSRLFIQRFARMPCLLQVRLAAFRLVRVTRLQHRAATTISRGFRRAAAQSAIVCAIRTLQLWSRRVVRRRKQLFSTVVIQQEWRRARQRRKTRSPTAKSLRQSAAATEVIAKASTINVPACMVADDRSGLVPIDVAQIDISGSKKRWERVYGSRADTGVLAGSSHTSRSSFSAYKNAQENITNNLPEMTVDCNDTSLKFCEQVLSPATTTREEWAAPDLSIAEECTESCCGQTSFDCSISHDEGRGKVVVTALRSSPNLRSTRRKTSSKEGQFSRHSTLSTVGRNKENTLGIGERSGGIVNLEDVLPGCNTRRRKTTPLRSRGSSRSVFRRTRTTKADDSRGGGDWPETPVSYITGEGVPCPPAGGTRPICARAPCSKHRWTRQVDPGNKSASHAFDRATHRRKATGSIDCVPPPFSFGFRNDVQNPSSGWEGTSPSGKASSGGASARKPSTRRTFATTKAGRGLSMLGVRESSSSNKQRNRTGSGIQCKGDAGGVLEMLASLEA